MKNSAGTISAAEQNRLVDAWSDQRPPAPKAKRPNEPMSVQPIFGIGIPLMFLGGLIGFVIAFPIWESAPVLAFSIFLASPFVVGLVIPVVVCIIIELAQGATYLRDMARTGWAEYEARLRTWRLIGDEDFGRWRDKNQYVMYALAMGQPHPYRHLSSARSGDVAHAMGAKALESKRDAKSVSSEVSLTPDEFDELEQYLDSLPEAPRHRMSLPSDWRLRRVARREARQKAAALAEGTRYIEEVCFSVHRPLSAVGGWISTSSSVTDEERVAIAKQIRPQFERYGLKVTNVLLMWTGMSDGAGGSYESFDLAIRLA